MSEYAHYAVFFLLITLTTLFYFTTIKMKNLTALTTLFYFSTIKMKYLTALTTLFFYTDYIHYAVLLHYY